MQSDDAVVADLCTGILHVLAECGGWLHPDARIVGLDGQLSITCNAPDGQPLVRVPQQAMIPIGRVSWDACSDELRIIDVPAQFNGAALELLYLQVALMNACGKVPHLVATHPVLAPGLPMSVVDAVREFRPSFRRRQPNPASLLWSNRCFRLPMTDDQPPEPILVPVVDLLNHHQQGATGQSTGDAFTVSITHADQSPACFLDYGLRRDAIGMAVVYGFVDASATVAYSAPVALDVPGLGPVRVQARGRDATGSILPVHARRDATAMTLSHLGFGPGQDPVTAVARATGWPARRATTAVRAIAEANLALAQSLIAVAAMAQMDPAARVLADAGRVQAAILESAAR